MRGVLMCSVCALLPAQQEGSGTSWRDAHELTVEGQAFAERAAPWDRLPARAEAVVREPVWDLSRHSAGIAVRFTTDSSSVHARWSVTQSRLAMPHMAATGVSGVDLYVRHDGTWRWLSCGRPRAQETNARLAADLPNGTREFLLYLPLYNGVQSLEIGVDEGATLEPGPARPVGSRLPIVFYGTSITHGACASRPGRTHVAIVGRHFDRPVVNLGFSGNGRMEPELADLLAEIDAAAYVVDCLPNMNGEMVAERAAPFVRRLRSKRPATPILLVEDRTYANAFLVDRLRERNEGNRQALRAAYAALLAEGTEGLHYLRAEWLLGADGDDTVDGSHPNDLGFERQAEAFVRVLGPVLDS